MPSRTTHAGRTRPSTRPIEAARQTTDFDERYAQYEIAQTEFAADLPYLPYAHPTNGFLYPENVHGATLYEDAILRMDLLWKDA